VRQQLAIAVKEQDYVKRLADYVRDSPFSEQWQLTAFTHVEAFVQFLKSGFPIHGIAAQPEMLKAAADADVLPEGVPVAALVTAIGQCPDYHELLQFQALPGLLQGIAAFMATAPHLAVREQEVNITTVYSASGGVGKTTLARQLVHTAASNGHRVFYLNLERWSAAGAWLGEAGIAAGEEGLSQLLYTLQSHPDKVGEWLTRHSKRHASFKGDYILPCTNPEDRMTLQAADAAAIIQAIVSTGQYDQIVIDLDDGQDELHLAVLELSHQILWLITEDLAVQRKSQLVYQYAMQRWGDRFRTIERRILPVINRSDGQSHALHLFKPAAAALPDIRLGSSTSVLASPLYKAAVERLFKELVREEGGALIADR
jgi:cellulose biosynthesis protein BcsQ